MESQAEDNVLEAGLYLVGTPIGNLGDITLRALEVLKRVNLILAEDTRQTRKLTSRFDMHVSLESCHRYQEASRVRGIVSRLREGQAIALVSDSGMPCISDPGSRLVAACREADVPVLVVPGPSAVTSAVALCGFGGRGFVFDGFLPVKQGQRLRRLEELSDFEQPVVLFEGPHRILATLEALDELLPERLIYIGRELTKKFEASHLGTASQLLERFRKQAPRGEFVLVLEPAAKRQDSGAARLHRPVASD
jgi:16S rRNA (cytidine1402-2'-O)-methyltransferase